ncbi:uncharacterized protein LOC114286392 [Camellia sinensis]|uniref:uncharacterized protein LOC114286392 n=1 Tax=Camellia sinensis TaxID=4442 RepID=UPI001036662B|nr:uncharacterized protein LOC114286392 [Camellia sinensis]
MASSSTNNNNIRLKPRLCDCGRTTIRTNENENQRRLFFVCPSKYNTKEHYNYFKFFDDDDDDITSTICSNAGPQTTIRTKEYNDLRRMLGEMDNEILEHGYKASKARAEFQGNDLCHCILCLVVLYHLNDSVARFWPML